MSGFIQGLLNLPGRKLLPGFPEAGLLPHCFVGDEAFPLRPDMMKPYPRGQRGTKIPEDQVVFNYRLSHAHRISENSFGILVQRWRVFDRRMCLNDHNAIKVLQAATVLHNFCIPVMTNADNLLQQLNPNGREYDRNAGALRNVARRGYRSPTDATVIRDWYKTYFFNPIGAMPNQMENMRYS